MKSRLLRGALLPSRNSSLSDIYVNEKRGAFPFPIQDKNEVTLPLQMWIVRLPATEITIAFRQCAGLIPGPQVLAGALLGEAGAPPIRGNYEFAVLMSNEVSALLRIQRRDPLSGVAATGLAREQNVLKVPSGHAVVMRFKLHHYRARRLKRIAD